MQALTSAEPDVAVQLKRLVAGMQAELGDQEVDVTRECEMRTGFKCACVCALRCWRELCSMSPCPSSFISCVFVMSCTGVIGQGSSGVVYQGVWRGLTVAVKSLVFSVLPSQPMSRRQQRAMMEAAICRTLQHPNIVATYAYDLQVRPALRQLWAHRCFHSQHFRLDRRLRHG